MHAMKELGVSWRKPEPSALTIQMVDPAAHPAPVELSGALVNTI
jgi:hypothetical protein